uniref:Ig-like domain-containing protein n=1 Tax=Kryptolebias marmoratus TaxID=37003 RepID=A0A3Q3BJV6_KRYMA
MYFTFIILNIRWGNALVPVITVQLGEPATLTCDLPDVWLGLKSLYWYKQDVGNSLKLITMLFNVTCYEKISSLTILGAVKEDEGMYHCAVISWTENTWSGTYLSIKGSTSIYNVVQQPAATDPDHPGGSVTLQCSILSDSEKKTCPGDLSVFWFRARSKDSHPDIIYTNGNSTDNCEKKSDPQKSCVYHFFKNISSSDAGTYYCAVATCGEIIFASRFKCFSDHLFQIKYLQSSTFRQDVILNIIRSYSTLNIIFLLILFQDPGAKDEWIYSTAVFTMMNADNKTVKEAVKRERIYAAVKAFGLD